MKAALSWFSRAHPAINILAINLVIAALWGVSSALNKGGFPYLGAVLGVLAFLTPGLNMSLALEQLSETRTKFLPTLLWSLIFSLSVTPAVAYISTLFIFDQSPINVGLNSFGLWWAISMLLAMIAAIVKRQVTSLQNLKVRLTEKKESLWVVGIFGLVMGLNFVLYPLLPEADGYAYLVNLENIQADPTLLAAETRGLFLIFTVLAAKLTFLDPYWIFKIYLPLAHLSMVISAYLLARQHLKNSGQRILFSLSPLFFPIILQEALISRPQSLFVIVLAPALVLTADIIARRENVRQVYYLVALALVGIIGIKIHALFSLIVVVGAVSLLVFLWREAAKRPADALLIGLALIIVLYPWISKTRLLTDAWDLISLFATSFGNGAFRFWFIDHYKNVDGIEAGWPGLTALFYYGYNLGVLFPVIFILLLIRKSWAKLTSLWQPKYWALLFILILFFVIAELAPRFDLAFLPDRAWLFIAIALSLALPIMATALSPLKNGTWRLLVIAAALSVVAGTGLTYAKQGWVSRTEVEAAEFIRNNTEENAIFLGQGSTRVMIRYYGKKVFVKPPESVYLASDTEALKAYLAGEENSYQEALGEMKTQQEFVAYKLREIAREVTRSETTKEQGKGYFEALLNLHNENNERLFDYQRLKTFYPTLEGPIYLVYVKDKFSSLYGTRGWWRTSNFYGANLDKFTAAYPVVYDQNGITIWKARD